MFSIILPSEVYARLTSGHLIREWWSTLPRIYVLLILVLASWVVVGLLVLAWVLVQHALGGVEVPAIDAAPSHPPG
jgi:hypothetical protein